MADKAASWAKKRGVSHFVLNGIANLAISFVPYIKVIFFCEFSVRLGKL